jgi:hypothetical protein
MPGIEAIKAIAELQHLRTHLANADPEYEAPRQDKQPRIERPSASADIMIDADMMDPPDDPVGWILAALGQITFEQDEGERVRHPRAFMGQDDRADRLLEILARTHHLQRPDYAASLAQVCQTGAEYADERHRISIMSLRWSENLKEWCRLRGAYTVQITGKVSEKARRIAEKRFVESSIVIQWEPSVR